MKVSARSSDCSSGKCSFRYAIGSKSSWSRGSSDGHTSRIAFCRSSNMEKSISSPSIVNIFDWAFQLSNIFFQLFKCWVNSDHRVPFCRRHRPESFPPSGYCRVEIAQARRYSCLPAGSPPLVLLRPWYLTRRTCWWPLSLSTSRARYLSLSLFPFLALATAMRVLTLGMCSSILQRLSRPIASTARIIIDDNEMGRWWWLMMDIFYPPLLFF